MHRMLVAVLLAAALMLVLAGCMASHDLSTSQARPPLPAQPAVELDLPTGLPLALDQPLAITLTTPSYTDVVGLAPWTHLGEQGSISRDVPGEQSGQTSSLRTFQDVVSTLLRVRERPVVTPRPREPAALTVTLPEPILLRKRLPISLTVHTFTDVVGMEVHVYAEGPQPVFQGETFWKLGDVEAGETIHLTSTVIFVTEADYDLMIAAHAEEGMNYSRSLRISLNRRDT